MKPLVHRSMRARWLPRSAMLCIWALALVCVRADEPGPKPPDRRELWVPIDKLGRVLDKKAVLLSREQYDALLRDAGVDKPKKTEAPAGVVLTSAVYRAVPEGHAASIRGELTVNVLRDGWNELPLEFLKAEIGAVTLDGEGVLLPRNSLLRADAAPAPDKAAQAAPKPRPVRPGILMIRGRGEHRLVLDLHARVTTEAGVNGLVVFVPGAASGTFTLTLPAGATMEKSDRAMKVTVAPDSTTAAIALSPGRNQAGFLWKMAGAAASRMPARAQAKVRYVVDAEKVAANFVIRAETALGALPEAFEFTFPAGMKINSVRANELQGWNAAAGTVTATFQPGERKALDIEIDAELPALAGRDLATLPLPLPVLKGVPRIDGILFISGGDDVIVQDVAIGSALRRIPTSEDRGERGYFGAYEFAGGAAGPGVTVERALPRLETDLDTLVEFRSDALFLTRTVTLREQKGRRFSASIALPAGEELIEVRRIEEPKPVVTPPPAQTAAPTPPPILDAPTECEPEWTREGGMILIKWSDETTKPRVFRLRSRVEPEKWTQMPPEGITFTLGDAKIADAAKVAGYIALTSDPAFRLEAQPGETLERRDGRSTPVRGDYAWFRRDAFELKVKIARRPAEVLAALTGYALPLEGLLDVRASMNYQFMGGGTRAVRIRVPKDLAQNFHFEGPQIAERALADDVWTITFQKELTGAYELAITAQVPVAKRAGDGADGAKGYSFAVKVPVISPLDVVRASGLWAVEANTETEIRFDATGMNELDSLLAPEISGYKPRHRVIGVFGWLGTEYSLALNGVRHAAAGMLTAVVDALELDTVISTSGLHRHEAVYRLRAAGVEYLDVALPGGARILSVAVDGKAVKPVADRPGSVRLPLPARRDTDTPVVASLTYETPAAAWKNRGTLELAAPAIAKEIPVLNSRWRVWVPEGFSYSDFQSNLPVPEVEPEQLLVRKLSRGALMALTLPFATKYSAIEAPDFSEDVASDRSKPGAAVGRTSDGEVLEKMREISKEGWKRDEKGEKAPSANAPLPPSVVEQPPTQTPVPGEQSVKMGPGKTAGLLPVSLDLPKGGSALVFGGLYAPERLVMRYDDWWSRAQRLWLWFVGGGAAFYFLVRQRPWIGTLWAALVLSAVPFCVSFAWMPVCNALLGGWLAGLVLNRLAAWCVFRNRREVLA